MQQGNMSKGHPKGLYVLFATEMWERFNYYGMRAVLVLFMTKALLFDKVFASNMYGSYTSLVFLTPLVGGYVADRLWGNSRSIVLGGIVMAIGEIFLFFCGSFYQSAPQTASILFFVGLGFMIAGNGFFKPNISSLVGQLYPASDRRIDAAYTIYYMGVNTGGAIGPIICGLVGDTGNPADFKWAFLAGAIGMVLSVIVQKVYQGKYVVDPQGKQLGLVPANAPKKASNPVLITGGLLLFSFLMIGILYLDANVFSFLPYLLVISFALSFVLIFFDKSLTKIDKQRVLVIYIVSFFVIFFWSAFEQAGASLTFFASEQTDRQIGSVTIPTSFFQSLNSIFVFGFAPVFAWLWIKLGRREPSSPTKMAWGLLLLALGFLVIAIGAKGAQPGVKVSMMWLVSMYAFHTWGELSLSPIGLSLVNKLAPIKFASLLMAVWFMANALANKLAGVLSALYPDKKTTHILGYEIANLYDFFILFVFSAGLASLILFLLSKKLQYMMKGGRHAIALETLPGSEQPVAHS